MGHEVDFLAVGEGERSGDAIGLRFGNLYGDRDEQFVMVIDGGTKESGEKLVEHVKQYYSTDTVDLVISTHPDNDHISGLAVVLEGLKAGRLWMHLPWNHSDDFRALFKDKRLTSIGLRERIRKGLDDASELEELAKKKGIPIDEPFSDASLPFATAGIHVLGPSTRLYRALLPHFRETPVAAKKEGLFRRAASAVAEAIKWVAESWAIETLTDPPIDASSAENNTSVVLLLELDQRLLLFTGDAGVHALTEAASLAEGRGFQLPSLCFMQAPHHGSRRNVGPTILDRVLGPKYQEPESSRTVYVSAAKGGGTQAPV